MVDVTKKRGHGEKASRKQETAIAALIAHGSLGQAALASKLSESTLRRWLKEPSFQAAYSSAKKEVFQRSIDLLRLGSNAAARALIQIAQDRESPAGARVAASRSIIDIGLNVTELQDLAERVSELQATLARGER